MLNTQLLNREMFLYRIVTILFISLVFLSISGCNNLSTQQREDIVAEIDGIESISFNELNKYYNDQLYNLRYPDSELDGYKSALNELIVKHRKEIDFVKSGLNQDSVLLQSIMRTINEEVVVMYFNDEFLSKYINEESIQNYYEDMGRKVTYRQIVLKRPPNAPKSVIDSLETVVNQIRNEIPYTDFGKLVRKYSEHQESAQNNGYMPPLTWENSATNPLINQIFNMNEGTTRALANANGFYIINVEKVEEIETPPLEEIGYKIVENLRKTYLDRSLEEFSDMKDNIISSSTFEWNQEAINQLLEWGKQRNFYTEHYQETFKEAIKNGNNFNILNYEKGKVDLRRLLIMINDILIPGKPDNLSEDDLKGFIEEALRSELIVKKAREMGKHEGLLGLDTPSSAIKSQFEWLYTEQIVDSKIPEPTEQKLREFYESEKDSLLFQFAKVNIYVRMFDSMEAARQFREKITQGQTFEEATNRTYKVKTYIINKEGEIVSFLSTEDPYLGVAAFELEEGKVSQPIEFNHPENGRQYAVFKSARKLEEKILDYSEVQNIEKKFRDFYFNLNSKSMRKNLENKYPATIHTERLESKVANLRN
ncbi:MAG: peptidylprolyl isomerase [Gracilimonas sp.]